MRRNRRYGEDESSEHMMLDTICNVFGAIVLMGVLVAVHTQAGAARLRQVTEAAALNELDARGIQLDINRIQAEIDQLSDDRSAYEERYAETVPPDMAALAEEYERRVKALAEAEKRLQAIGEELAACEESIGETADQTEDLHEQAKVTEDRTDQLEDRNDQLEDSIDQLAHRDERRRSMPDTVRLPWSHMSTADTQLHFVVVGNRVFPVDEYHCNSVSVTLSSGTFVPVPGRGFEVTANDPNLGFVRSLKGTGRTHYVVFWLNATDRAFETVQVLRRIVAERRYEFGYAVFPAGAPITWMSGNGQPVQ